MNAPPDIKTVLVLEDDPNDSVLIRRAFTNAVPRIFLCRNTSEARAYLGGAGMYSDREQFPFPSAFVLDIRLGNESGVDFLEWLRSKDEFRYLPVVVLSGAATPNEVLAVKKLGAARILQKSPDPRSMHLLLTVLAEELGGPPVENWNEIIPAEASLVEA